MITTINVVNMRCHGCANSVQDTVGKLPGVQDVQVDVASQAVKVSHDGTTKQQTIIAALDRMGYPQADQQTVLKQAKSLVSCAIGRMK